jgi:hypothetical protein
MVDQMSQRQRFFDALSAIPLVGLAIIIGGCSAEATKTSTRVGTPAVGSAAEPGNAANSEAAGRGALVSTAVNKAVTAERRLIYSARISVETPDLQQFSQQLEGRVAALGGFIANYQDVRRTGTTQSGKWTVRLDADKFEEMLGWLDESASVLSKQVSSQDVTEEFVDLNARLANKRNTETRLAKILDDRPGGIEDVLAVERELDRVREEIERIEGRLRFLSDRVALSTIEITANTRVEYQVQEVGLFQRVSEGWQSSLNDLRRAAENTLVGFVWVSPWLASLALLLFVGAMGYRVFRRAFFASSSPQ